MEPSTSPARHASVLVGARLPAAEHEALSQRRELRIERDAKELLKQVEQASFHLLLLVDPALPRWEDISPKLWPLVREPARPIEVMVLSQPALTHALHCAVHLWTAIDESRHANAIKAPSPSQYAFRWRQLREGTLCNSLARPSARSDFDAVSCDYRATKWASTWLQQESDRRDSRMQELTCLIASAGRPDEWSGPSQFFLEALLWCRDGDSGNAQEWLPERGANRPSDMDATSHRDPTPPSDADPLSVLVRPRPPEEDEAAQKKALQASFRERERLLSGALTTSEVASLLGVSRQTPHDRVKGKALLGIEDRGVVRFPLWQFDADSPTGVVPGLSQVLAVLKVSPLAQARWLSSPSTVFEGRSPLTLLKEGNVERVVREACGVGAASGHG